MDPYTPLEGVRKGVKTPKIRYFGPKMGDFGPLLEDLRIPTLGPQNPPHPDIGHFDPTE